MFNWFVSEYPVPGECKILHKFIKKDQISQISHKVHEGE